MKMTTFADLGVPEDLVAALSKAGFDRPFEIQVTTIPDMLAGRDVCGRAATGSGKTLAFGLPLVANVGQGKPGQPRALVLAPTRELAEQILREIQPLAKARSRSMLSVYGGVGYGPQRKALRRGVDILVACPGRLADLINQGDVSLSQVDRVVIDEADRMADMGFLPEVRRLLDRCADQRQTVLFSATLDGEVDVLKRDYQRDPVTHHVGELEPDITAMQHHFWRLEPSERLERTVDVIQASGQTIVFSRTRRGADRIAKKLNRSGLRAAAIHGSRSQNQRNRALDDFTRERVQALVATDVAARGIHVDGIRCVLHFDPPGDEKTYLHRSGRTARAGAQGVVVTFVLEDMVEDVQEMQRALELGAPLVAPTPERLFDGDGSPLDAPTGPVPQKPGSRNGRPSGQNGSGRSSGGGRRRRRGGGGGRGKGRSPQQGGGDRSRSSSGGTGQAGKRRRSRGGSAKHKAAARG